MKTLAAGLLVVLLLQSAVSQEESYSQLAKHFDYNRDAPLDIKEVSVEDRAGVKIHNITYASPQGGRVPAYLIVPPGKGKFAAILWGHWMMPNSPTANRSEFLDEAVALAQAGAVSLLIDAPYVRPGFKRDTDPLSPQDPNVVLQEVVDLRRGLDLLLARSDVDEKRVAFVGHSFNADCGAVLDAVDKRVATFVLMGNPVSIREAVLSEDPQMVAFRKSVGDEKVKAYLNTYSWADPASYAAYLGPAPAFFQYATHDEFVPVSMAQHYFDMSKGSKEIKFYDANHALNAPARRDRYEWLRKYIGLGTLPPGVLDKVPATK